MNSYKQIDKKRDMLVSKRRVQEIKSQDSYGGKYSTSLADIELILKREGHINASTCKAYTCDEIRIMYHNGDVHQVAAVRSLAIDKKSNGFTYIEVKNLLLELGYINPLTKKPYGLWTIRKWTKGINSQAGHRGKTYGMSADELAEHQRLKRERQNGWQRDFYYRNRESQIERMRKDREFNKLYNN